MGSIGNLGAGHGTAPEPGPGPAGRAAGAEQEPTPERRRFLARLGVGLAGVGATIIGIPVIGFLVAPLFRRVGESWRPVGPASAFRVGETVKVTFPSADAKPWSGATGATAAWLRRDDTDAFTAFSLNCTHLGCPVRWVAGAKLFMCPCHGGVFYQDGAVAAGPPPRALTRYPVRVREGQVFVQTSELPIT